MQGMRVWKNEKNLFTVVEIHYTADPAKRSAKWKELASSGLPVRQWNQEYEIKWLSFSGLPVYGDWNERVHVAPSLLEPHVGLPLLIGFDFGLCAAAIVGQLQEETLVILKEYTSTNMGADRFCKFLKPKLKQDFPSWGSLKRDYLCFADPSGQFRKDTDENTCFNILCDHGFDPEPGPIDFEARRTAVEYFLTRLTKKGPCFQINEGECPALTKGFKGGYHYPEKSKDIEPTVLAPVKNIFSHPHDALQYLCAGISGKNMTRRHGAVPGPSYGIQKR